MEYFVFSGRKHNTDDIIATVLAVEPMRFIYRGRIAVFSIKVLRDERVCVVAEQRPDCSEEESFQVRTEPSDWSKAQIKSSNWLTHPAFSVDVPSPPGSGLHPQCWPLLPRPGASQPLAQDSARRDPSVRDQEEVPRGLPAPSQCPDVPPHLRHQPAQASGGPQ